MLMKRIQFPDFRVYFFFCTFPYCVTTAEGDEGMETSQREPDVRQKKKRRLFNGYVLISNPAAPRMFLPSVLFLGVPIIQITPNMLTAVTLNVRHVTPVRHCGGSALIKG